MSRKKYILRTETIDGFEIRYESEEGRTFAIGYCPRCGHKEESMQMSMDAGKITASKLRTHFAMAHKENSNGKTSGEEVA